MTKQVCLGESQPTNFEGNIIFLCWILGELLHEILLVDDFSDKEDLGDKLEGYIKRFRGKV